MARRLFLCLLTLFFSPTALRAQLNRSVIEGVVTDPRGAVVPGAEVIALSLDSNVSSPTRTNNTGYYRLPNLVPGRYQAHFTASGFAPLEVLEIELPAGQTVRVDAEMKLGTSHQLVQVTAEPPLLETAASNFSASVEERSIREIPLQGRDIQQLVYLLPGVANVAGPPGSNFGFNSQFGTFPDPTYMQGSDVAVNGGQGGANAWYLDGNLNLSGLAENVAVNPSPDSVAEFQVVSNGFAAEYGRTGGGVFSVVLRSGSNAVHGNIYEFLRNSATNARNPFTSIDATGKLIKDRDLHFNNFGGTLGGPVVIPHVYDGRNRTFFFFSFDHQILHLNGNQVFSVPTARMRRGDFSEDPNSGNFGIWNPYSTIGPSGDGLFSRTAFGTPLVPNGCLNSTVEAGRNQGIQTCNFSTQLPANLMDPTAMFFVQSFPLPNYNDPLSGCPMGLDGFKICNNYLGGVGSSQNPYNISVKIDHQSSGKSKYFAEWIFNPGKYNIYRLPWSGPTFPSVGWGGNLPFDFKNQIVGLGHTYVASSTLVNEFRAGFSRQFITTHPSEGSFPEEVTHQTEVNETLAPARIFVPPYTPSPTFLVGMPAGGLATFGPPGFISMQTAVEAYTLLDNITKTLGRHTLKAGFLYRLEHAGRTVNTPTGLVFLGGLAQDPNTNQGGSGLAQFMLGAVDNNSGTGLLASPYQRSRYWGFYVQDDFRLTPKFTVNLGLRYDINGFFKTREGPMSNFCLTCLDPTTGLKGKMIYWGDPEFPTGHDMAPANKNSLGPRVNFSWAPFADRKTIIRGGYDIFYTNAGNSYNNVGQGIAPGPQWQTFNYWTGSFYPDQCAPFSGQCVAFPLSDTTTDKGALTQPPVPSDLQFPAAHRDPSYGAAAIQFYYPPPRDPMVQMWISNESYPGT